MKKESILYVIIGLLAGIVITGIVFVFLLNREGSYMNKMMGLNNQNRNADKMFIEQMIPHHESAIAMANLALQKSSHSELKTLANNIISTQTEEINKMKQWYKDWYGTEVPAVPAGMMSGMMSSEDSVDDLNAAANFDEAFLSQMIGHHEMAVMMSSMLKSSTDRDEMKGLADNIISTQNKEIDDMKSWQQQWGYASTDSQDNDMMDMMHSGH